MKKPFFPETLKDLPIWILWRLEPDEKGRMTKVPYSAKYDGRASSTNPRTWSSYEEAKAELERDKNGYYNGIGIMLSEEYHIVFIDIDKCVDENGEFDERGKEALTLFSEQYIELSQSGKGLHIFAKGTIPRNFKNSTYEVEMYSSKRFCAMTGNALQENELYEVPNLIAHMYNKYKTQDRTGDSSSVKRGTVTMSDKEIIGKCESRGGKFCQLYCGEWESLYNSQSEADLSLCIILAFWTDRDIEAIDRIFRSSGLCRSKWERADYRFNTISRACAIVEESISEYTFKRECERRKNYGRIFISQW